MRHVRRTTGIALTLAVGLLLAGCYSSEEKDKAKGGGGHPTVGPHKGVLIELGDEEYHGEFVVDHPTKKATVYILDSDAKKAVPIDAKTITLFITKKDKSDAKIEMTADPDNDDPEGKSSRFVGTDEVLAEEREFQGKIELMIGETSYNGKFDEAKGHVH